MSAAAIDLAISALAGIVLALTIAAPWTVILPTG
jgi:hypothetical protein